MMEIVKVKVGLRGVHYHLPDCPVVQKDSFLDPSDYDYLVIEVPKEIIDKNESIVFLKRSYRSHIPVCKALIRREKR